MILIIWLFAEIDFWPSLWSVFVHVFKKHAGSRTYSCPLDKLAICCLHLLCTC